MTPPTPHCRLPLLYQPFPRSLPLLLNACSDGKHVKRNSLCGIFAILLQMEDVPFKSVRQFRVVKLSTHMSVKYYCNNNADLRDCETHIQIAVIKNYKSTALKLNF